MRYQLHITLEPDHKWFSFLRAWLFGNTWVYYFESDDYIPEILANVMKTVETTVEKEK